MNFYRLTKGRKAIAEVAVFSGGEVAAVFSCGRKAFYESMDGFCAIHVHPGMEMEAQESYVADEYSI